MHLIVRKFNNFFSSENLLFFLCLPHLQMTFAKKIFSHNFLSSFQFLIYFFFFLIRTPTNDEMIFFKTSNKFFNFMGLFFTPENSRLSTNFTFFWPSFFRPVFRLKFHPRHPFGIGFYQDESDFETLECKVNSLLHSRVHS